MKYQQPYGNGDADAPYVNGNPAIGLEGSIPPAEAFEHPQRELVDLIEASGLTPDEEDLAQVAKSVQRQRVNYAAAGGTASAITATLAPALTAYVTGMPVRVKVATTNAGATTLNVNGLGAKPIRNVDGTELRAGQLVAGEIATLLYEQTADAFLLSNSSGRAAGRLLKVTSGGPGVDHTTTVEATAYTAPAYAPFKGANPRLIIGQIYHRCTAVANNVQTGSFVRLKRQIAAGPVVTLKGSAHIGTVATLGDIEAGTSPLIAWDTEDTGGDTVTYLLSHYAGNAAEESSTVYATNTQLTIMEFGSDAA